MESTDIPVLVIGAGPVGMAAALALRSRGLPAVVLECDPPDRVRPGSRALFVHRRSLHLLEAASPGLGRRLAEHGICWQSRRTLYRGRTVYSRAYPMPAPDRLPPFTSLRQTETERLLAAACDRAGVEIRWSARVTEVRSEPDSVTVTLADGTTMSASYLIAADGARSPVRRGLGVGMSGSRSSGFHVVLDVEEAPGDPTPADRVFRYEDPAVGGRSVMRVPFAGGFQVDLQCWDDDRPVDFDNRDAVSRWLPPVVGQEHVERVRWVSTYHFMQLVADSFVDPHRRVLLTGEAAHLFPPFGARGMNSGFADAVAAADAIAAALATAPGPASARGQVVPIEAFAAARRSAAHANSAAAGAALRHLRPSGPVPRLRQRTAAALAPVIPRLGVWLEQAPYGPRRAAVGY